MFIFQCRGGFGVCPDTQLAGLNCVNNIDASKVRGGIRNGKQQCVVFSRNFITGKVSTCVSGHTWLGVILLECGVD